MGVKGGTLYVKIDENVVVTDRHVKLSDVAKLQCADPAIVRQLKQKRLYTFAEAVNPQRQKNERAVFSVMKVIQMIQEDYPNVAVENIGAGDFIVEYEPDPVKPRWVNAVKTVLLCVVIFFGAAFTIMAFNNDVGVAEVFSRFYEQVMGQPSDGVTEIEICYSIGLALGILVFFNHVGRKKITPDPTPMQVQMRKYETDIDDAFIENAQRKGHGIDVD